ncbi:MAG TPA: Flp pilus assembly protein CpaB [Candidatus Dormibacteraeota bacterium]|nr:Flp pilus assembly protein CpaB [Candidatus Dormibacteraeota bacterium]
MNKRNTLLIVAAVLAAGAGLLTFNYLSSSNRNVASAPPRPVLVAIADIPAHTPVTSSMVNVVMRPSSDVDSNALSSPSDISGDVALGPIPAGAAITSSNTSKDEAPVRGLHLMRGYRAISIPVDEVRDVSGLVEPGDKVDVIAVPPRVGAAQPTASIILHDVTVFAVGGELAPSAPSTPTPGSQPVPNVPRSVTLEVTPNQADLLAMADLNTTLRLALRPKGDPSGSSQDLVFASQTFAAPPPPVTSSGPAPGPRRALPYSSVEIIEGDQIGAPDTSGSSTR